MTAPVAAPVAASLFSLKGRRVLVSGGAGVIGCELVPRLLEAGATVFVGDLRPRPETLTGCVRYRQGDLCHLTRAEWDDFDPEVFIHLAAAAEPTEESEGFYEENFHHNLALSHHLMGLARGGRALRRVVFASSYLIYDPALYQFDAPRAEAVALRERDPIDPRNLTAMAKLAHELELRSLAGFESTRFTSVCARIYRGYGCNSRDVISRWVRALLAGEAITVFRPDGRFDYIYAADTAEGLLRLAVAEARTGIINLGTGQARRVAEVVECLRAHFPGLVAVAAPSDIPFEASAADLHELRAALGWSPPTALEAGVARVVAFERARGARAPVEIPAPRVLVSSASRKVPLVRALMQAADRVDAAVRIVAGDLDPRALTAHVAHEFWAMPRTTDTELDALLAGCRARHIRQILPTRDGELAFYAAHRERFAAEGVDVVVSPRESVERCLDKLAFAGWGRAAGLPTIPAALEPDAVGPGPYVVKERYGAGSRSLGLRLDRDAALAHAARLEAPIFQPFVEGPEISADAWLDREHQLTGLVLRRRDVVQDGESQVTTTFRDAALEALVARLLTAMPLRGPIVVQVLLDPVAGPQIVECNTRFGGASTASAAVGLDALGWTLREVLDPTAPAVFTRAAREIRQVRVPADLILPASP